MKAKSKYFIFEEKSKDDFSIMLEQHEQAGYIIRWDTYKIIQINDSEGTSETWYSVMLEWKEEKAKDRDDYGELGK